jgi:transcriptional regulator with XRE-family HTH domain
VANIPSERERFSQRLQQTLRNAHHSPDSPTELAREFNIRFSGRPITVHAARKWLVGEAIPTQDKMRTLAEWLMVPIDWLRFGTEDERSDAPAVVNVSSIDIKLIADMQLLDEHHRQIVREFVRILIRTSRAQADGDARDAVESRA